MSPRVQPTPVGGGDVDELTTSRPLDAPWLLCSFPPEGPEEVRGDFPSSRSRRIPGYHLLRLSPGFQANRSPAICISRCICVCICPEQTHWRGRVADPPYRPTSTEKPPRRNLAVKEMNNANDLKSLIYRYADRRLNWIWIWVLTSGVCWVWVWGLGYGITTTSFLCPALAAPPRCRRCLSLAMQNQTWNCLSRGSLSP